VAQLLVEGLELADHSPILDLVDGPEVLEAQLSSPQRGADIGEAGHQLSGSRQPRALAAATQSGVGPPRADREAARVLCDLRTSDGGHAGGERGIDRHRHPSQRGHQLHHRSWLELVPRDLCERAGIDGDLMRGLRLP
jgi:hypothetical protein